MQIQNILIGIMPRLSLMHKRRLQERRDRYAIIVIIYAYIVIFVNVGTYFILWIWEPLLKYLYLNEKSTVIRQIILSLVCEYIVTPAHRPVPRSGFQPFWYLFVKYLQWYMIPLWYPYTMFSWCVFVYNTTAIIVLTKTGSPTDRQ